MFSDLAGLSCLAFGGSSSVCYSLAVPDLLILLVRIQKFATVC